MEKNPYSDFTIKSQEGKRMFLTSDEVKKIMELKITPDKQYLDKIRDTFLFSCFCGLRFSDMESLTWNHITEEAICIRMKKTNKEVTIPLIPQTKKLLDKYKPNQYQLKGEKIFPTISNQKTNDYLKEVGKLAGIKKTITTHIGRHTFATMHISAGTHMLNLRDLLGHHDIAMTEIYAK